MLTQQNDEHVWKPTTNTHAVWQCARCGGVGFAPHPLPKTGCDTAPPNPPGSPS